MVKLLALLCLAGSTAYAQPRGLGTPFVDKIAQKFLDASPKSVATITGRDLDELLFPGGQACDRPQAAMPGFPSQFSTSPDGKTLLVVTTVAPDDRTAKALGVPAGKLETIVLGFTAATGAMWSATLADGGGCDRHATQVTWSRDGKRALAVGAVGTFGTERPHVVTIDVAGHALRGEELVDEVVASASVTHVATRTGDSLAIDGATVWTGAASALAWTTDTRLTFCGGGARYRVDVGGEPVKLGACS